MLVEKLLEAELILFLFTLRELEKFVGKKGNESNDKTKLTEYVGCVNGKLLPEKLTSPCNEIDGKKNNLFIKFCFFWKDVSKSIFFNSISFVIIFSLFFWSNVIGGALGMLLAIPLSAFIAVFWRLLKKEYFSDSVATDGELVEPVTADSIEASSASGDSTNS